MRLFEGSPAERRARLISLLTVLAILVTLLAAFALLDRVFLVMNEFRGPILLFLAGAIVAYLMAPLVRMVQVAVRNRALAIATSYLLLFAILVLLGAVLANPFVKQARALRGRLNNPSTTALRSVNTVRASAAQLQKEIDGQRGLLASGQTVPADTVHSTSAAIDALSGQIAGLSTGPRPKGEVPLPPSYLTPLSHDLARLSGDYGKWRNSSALVDQGDLNRASEDAGRLTGDARTVYRKAGSTPLLLLNLQSWLDRRGMTIDLHDKFGTALQTVSSQLSNIVNNAVTVALQAGTLLLNTLLILIVSVYLLSDGARFVRWLVSLVPAGSRGQAQYFVVSLDKILGAYLRTQLLIAFLAAFAVATGAVIFGVPYATVIFLMTFVLSLVPVIGPLVVPFPPILIAVIFTPLPVPILYTLWVLAAEQIITNIIGPRVQGNSVGIHPLEAMAAALIGFPIAGFLGAFFAVPMVGFLHVLVGSLAEARNQARSAQEAGTPEAEHAAGVGERPLVGGPPRA